jgi:hypothetical protein
MSPSSIQTPARSTSGTASSACAAPLTRSVLSVPGKSAKRATSPLLSVPAFFLLPNLIRHQLTDEHTCIGVPISESEYAT